MSSSITSKEWEYIDPTPDIHMLFLQFNQRFFWGKLEGVEVKWSPRMKLCAGVCCYEGRGGLCSVRLSEPLLKLRPRKDLVETLLHEMIHAFLFVTQNNRDRDGHGPEFQKHMKRINNESGCNITIYHSFHAEVKLYQQHVWRCDGPCQKQHPFFGFLRRSANRAPGPNDTWFSQHQATCGGTYIKIQEPYGYAAKKTKKAEPKQNKAGDITKYIFTGKGNTVGAGTMPGDNAKSKVNGQTDTAPVKPGNVKSFGDFTTGQTSSGKNIGAPRSSGTNLIGAPSTSGTNLKGFADFGKPGGVVRGAVSNRGGKTLVVTAGGRGRTTTDPDPGKSGTGVTPAANFVPFQGPGFVLGASKVTGKSGSGATKVSGTSGTSANNNKPGSSNNVIATKIKQEFTDNNVIVIDESPPKKIKTDPKITKWFSPTKKGPEPDVKCPVCSKVMPAFLVDAHLDTCNNLNKSRANEGDTILVSPTKNSPESDVKSPVCSKVMPATQVDTHLVTCNSVTRQANGGDTILVSPTKNSPECDVKCPVCSKVMPATQMDTHLDDCLSLMNMSDIEPRTSDVTKPSSSVSEVIVIDDDEEENLVQCPLCEGYYSADRLETHITECVSNLHDMFEADDLAQQTDNLVQQSDTVPCPICQRRINPAEVNKHVDECLNQVAIKQNDFTDW